MHLRAVERRQWAQSRRSAFGLQPNGGFSLLGRDAVKGAWVAVTGAMKIYNMSGYTPVVRARSDAPTVAGPAEGILGDDQVQSKPYL
jgi:hypothetical protein